jgi:trehalose-6-phosphate synthase
VGERIVVGGVEMLNPLQGALIKLLAYEKLLEAYAMWRPRLTMLQVGRPAAWRSLPA